MRHYTTDKVDIMKVKYGVSRIIAFQVDMQHQELEILGYGFNSKQSATVELTTKSEEEFYIYVEMDYNIKLANNTDIILSAYSKKPIYFEYIKTGTQFIRDDVTKTFLTGLLAAFAYRQGGSINHARLEQDGMS